MVSGAFARLSVMIYLVMCLSIITLQAATCDCGDFTGRPVEYPVGIESFDENDLISEADEALLRIDKQLRTNELCPPQVDNMTDVLEVQVNRVDGFADRDGLWNLSDPYLSIWSAGPDDIWTLAGTSSIVEGCDGEICDAVFDLVVRIPIPRSGLYSTAIEVFDDDPGGTPELLGKKGFRRIPSSGFSPEWRLLDDNNNWSCWANFGIEYEDNGIDDPSWIETPPPGQISEVLLEWSVPSDRAGILKTEVCLSIDAFFGNADDIVTDVYGQTDHLVIGASNGIPSGQYNVAIRAIDNNGWASNYVSAGVVLQWLEPTPVPPTATPSPTPNPNTPTPMPGSFMVGDVRIYADTYEQLQTDVFRATGNIRINDYISVEGQTAFLILHTGESPWIEGQGLVKLRQTNLPVFIGDFEIEPVAANPGFGLLIPGDFLSQLIELAGYFIRDEPISLSVNVVEGWIYIETLVEINVDAIGLHVARIECVLDWSGALTGNIYGFNFVLAGVELSFDHGLFNNSGIHIDHFNITLPPDMGGGYADAWGIHITTEDIFLDAAHIVLPLIRLDGGFEITGFDPNTGPEAWLERLPQPFTGYKWCVDGRMRIPNLGDANGTLGIETTFSIYGDRLQQACLVFEAGGGLQIPIGTTGLFLYKLGGCVTFNNLPYPDPNNQCATGTIYDCNAEAFTCCHFNYPDSVKVKLIAGLQGGPDILGLKCVHADPLWLDIDTGWGIGGGGSLRVIENFEVGAGRVCVSPHGTRVDGWISIAIVQGSLYLLVTPDHAEGSIEGSVTIPPGDYWLFDLDEPLNLGQFMLMLGYYNVPQSDFWGSGIWSTCNSSHCEGLKYGVRYSHEIFGQLLCIAMDENKNFYAWIDLALWGSMKVSAKQEILEVHGDSISVEDMTFIGSEAEVPIAVPSGMDRSLFTLGFQGDGLPSLRLRTPNGVIIDPASADNETIFYNRRDGAIFYSIRGPEHGNWTFLVNDTDGLDHWEVRLQQGNHVPVVEIDSVEISEQRAKIQWAGSDRDSVARVDLYYDTDNLHADGQPIATALSSGQGNQLTHWDLSGITSGTYYLYAKIDDGNNPPIVSYLQEPIQIVDTIAPQAPGNLSGAAGINRVHLWWNAPADSDLHSYQLRYGQVDTDDFQVLDVAQEEVIVGNLERGQPYRFTVVARDLSNNWSQQSNELILNLDGSGDLEAPHRVSDVQAMNQGNSGVSVSWDFSVSTDVAYYLVHYGASPDYYGGTEADQGRSPIQVMFTENQIQLTGLTRGARYYFRVQAVDRSRNKSILSSEVTAAMISDDDDDLDSLPDDWEARYWGSLDRSGEGDDDQDGLTNAQEFSMMTNPTRVDTDFDRIPDNHDSDPLRNLDLDVDGISDDWEKHYHIEDATADLDNDMLSNLQEYRFGTFPESPDTDGDGLSDGYEARNESNPTDPDDPNPRCEKVGVNLIMPSTEYTPGDLCYLSAEVCNSFHVPIPEARIFTLMTFADEVFFAPGWSYELDYWSFGIKPGPYELVVIKPFVWPSGVGNGSGISFIGAITDSDITEILGEMSFLDVSWYE